MVTENATVKEVPQGLIDKFYDILEKCNALKNNYNDYMTSHPIDYDSELIRLPNADYDLCCALITMLLREDRFSEGSFERRCSKGEVIPIIERMWSFGDFWSTAYGSSSRRAGSKRSRTGSVRFFTARSLRGPTRSPRWRIFLNR